ncbi:probable glutamate receptor [Homarus americanus]|uniref:probable glutamate receptor n=1 Tax=Homarus americanus TaxID=6706 RepID=UPI001C48C952|nr:probable glutamate receptor [Homarus americanus]
MRGTRMVLTLIICIIICVAGLTNSQEHLTHDTTLVEFNSANLSQVERMTPGVKNQLVSLAENKCHEQPPASTSKHAASQHSCTSPASTDLVHKRPSAKLESDTSPVTLRDKIKNINKVLFDRYEKEETSADMLDAASLSRMLVAVVEEEMEECNVVVAYDAAYSHPAVLHRLLLLPNARQVVKVNKTQDLLEIVWVSSGCSGYVFLLQQLDPLLTFVNTHPNSWDYHGRYLFVVPSKDDLEFLALSEKGKKTEHIVGATESGAEGEWGVYMNQLYWSQGVKRVTTWRGHRFSSQVDLFPDKLRDLQGAVLKAVAFEWKPSVFYQRAKNGTVLLRYGIDIGVVKTLAQVLNFTIQFVEPPEGQHWGYEVNGSWTGMVGMLSKNEVDMGMVNLYVSIVRTSILDYSAPYDSELSCFMARTEPPLPRWQALAYPFQGITWLAILIGLIISGPVLYLLARGSAVCGEEMKSLQSLSFSCYYALGLHCCEAQVTLPQMKSTRVFIIFLWLYTITITIAYSTNLTAFLMVSKSPATMETIKELHASRKQVSGMGQFYKGALASASDPDLQSLTKVYQGHNNDEHIFPGVLDGKAVFLQNRAYIEYVVATKFFSRGQSRMRVMKECFSPYNIALGLQRHSPIKRKFDQVIGWMLNAGLTRHFFLTSLRLSVQISMLKREGDDESAVAEDTDVVEREVGIPLSLDHLQGIFFVIVIGWVASLLLFLLEISPEKQ